MTLELSGSDNFISIWEKITKATEEAITVVIPGGHPLLDNVLNLKLLKAEAKKVGKTLELTSLDEGSQRFLAGVFGEGFASNISEPTTQEYVPAANKIWFPAWLSFSSPRFKPFKFALIFAAVFGGGVLLVAGYWAFVTYVPRATVTLKFSPEALSKNVLVTLSSDITAVDSAKHLLPAQKLLVYATASAQLKTTGQKTVGETARGTITIYNKTSRSREFSKNTPVSLVTTDAGEWSFTLDSGVTIPERTVASTSATLSGENITYNFGQARAGVTAKNIGSKYNLPASSQFNIGSEQATDFLAKSEGDFTGGKEYKVAAVAQADRDSLSRDLTDQLTASLWQKLALAVEPGLISASEGASLKVISENFNKGVGEPAETISLTATGAGISYVFKAEDIKKVWQELVAQVLPPNYSLSDVEKELAISLVAETVNTNTPQLLIKGVSYLVPKYLAEDLQKNLVGKSLTDANNYLKALSGVDTVKITVGPPIFGLASRLPSLSSSIKVVIEKP